MSMIQRARRQAGDTLIEVLLAIVIISVVIAGAYSATNNGLRIGQNSIERTQASETTAAQAEALRTLRDLKATNTAANTAWTAIASKVTTTTPSGTVCDTGGGTPTVGSNAFWLDTTGSSVVVTNGTKTQRYLKYWVEAYRPNANSGYIDFYINGCWQPVGEPKVQDTGIVVRLAV